MAALATGMEGWGDEAVVSPHWPKCQDFDFVAVWGARPAIPAHFAHLPVLYLEAGYINGSGTDYIQNRLRFYSTEWNGMCGLADPFEPKNGKRWRRLDIPLAPWKPDGNRALVLEQHPRDAAAVDAAYPPVHKALKAAGYLVRVRQHPLIRPDQRPLAADLEDTDIAVTFSSTAAVEAVLAGIPTVTLSEKAVARPVTSHSVEAPLWRGNRKPWLYGLAYRQWTLTELQSGEAWDNLRRRFPVAEAA